MRPVAIFEPNDDEGDREVGTLVLGDRDWPDDAQTLAPMTREEAERLARENGFEFELLR